MQNELDPSTGLSDDELLFQLREIENKAHFYQKDYAVVHYVPSVPISLNISPEKMMRELKKSVMRDCNEAYANAFGYKKEALINKKTINDQIPNNFVNLSLLKQLVKNRFCAEGVESLQYDAEGNEKWFINFVFFEIKNNTIIGIWTRKREITNEKNSVRHFVDALSIMLESRDAYTVSHQKRVTKLAKRIAIEYGLEPDAIGWLELAAAVHDIGKIAIPAEILSKPIKLTSVEFALIKMHPEVGYKILNDFDGLGPVSRIVYQHHERLDGSGYPLGLKGDAILIEAKILAVADVVESMVSHRPYRPAHSLKETLDEIKNQRGIKLDPKAVDICVALFEKETFTF